MVKSLGSVMMRIKSFDENHVDENHVDKKKIGEPVYRGMSVFHNMEKIDDDETNQEEEAKEAPPEKDPHLVWKDLLNPQFKDLDKEEDDGMENILPLTVHCDPDEENDESRKPPGNVRGASLSTKAYMSGAVHGAGEHESTVEKEEESDEDGLPPERYDMLLLRRSSL